MPDNTLAASEARLPTLLDGRPFTALLQDDDERRDAALSRLLFDLARPDVRVVRMGNSMHSRLMLEHILIQVTGPDGRTSQDDSARLIARTIAERRGREAFVVLLITQAETLHSKTLLQAMRPYLAESGAPTLHVVFVGRRTFQALLEGRGMAPLREALGLPPPLEIAAPAPGPAPAREVASPRPLPGAGGVSEPVALREPALESPLTEGQADDSGPASIPPKPRAPHLAPTPAARRGRTLAVGAAVFAAMALAASIGLNTAFYRKVEAPRALSLPGSVASSSPAAPSSVMPTPGPAAPDPPASVPVPDPAPPVLAPPVLAPPSDAGRSLEAPPAARSSTDPAEPSSRPPIEDVPPPPAAPSPSPRIVIHVPTGSEGAEAMSAYLRASLGSRLGTVEARRVVGTPARPSIRYYYPGDEPVARQLAARMAGAGLTWTLQDFSTFQPRPSRGTIEVWLPRP